MREHEPALVQGALEHLAVDARLGRHRQRFLVHLDDAVEAREVEQDAAPDRNRPSLAARAAAARDDGETSLVGEAEHRGDAGLVGRQDGDVREAERRPARLRRKRLPVGVGGVALEPVRVGDDRVVADEVTEVVHERLASGRPDAHDDRRDLQGSSPETSTSS